MTGVAVWQGCRGHGKAALQAEKGSPRVPDGSLRCLDAPLGRCSDECINYA